MKKGLALACNDLIEGAKRYELWSALAQRDITVRYRRSLLGPLWITLNMAVIAFILGGLYSTLLNQPPREYIPYLAVGFMVWTLLSSLLTEGCQTFIANTTAIQEIVAPKSIYAYRIAWRNAVSFFYNLFIYAIIAAIFSVPLSSAQLLFFPGLVILLLDGVAIALALGAACARYRDIVQVVGASMRFLFFATPVMWLPSQLGDRAFIAELNPLYYLIEVVRSPLLGQVPSLGIWTVVVIISAILWSCALLALSVSARRIPFWV